MTDEELEGMAAGRHVFSHKDGLALARNLLSARAELATVKAERDALMPMIVAVENAINEPQPGRDEHPDVCDYRHHLYGIWSPLCRALQSATPKKEQS